MTDTLIELKDVAKGFKSTDGSLRTVLERVDFRLAKGEIVALLGQSGSGKSTLLRIMAGLIPADAGDVRYRGQPLFGPAQGIAMVFQSFALFPWLTVQQNVELGLEAAGVGEAERAQRAEAAIELIGLAGFEGALPRELSGGMRQRVGLARALVMQPAVLLMDEAFSALDVLTGERLRNEILELWDGGQMPTQAMLVVSHNIEEAVMMADRVLIFASNPGRVRAELPITLARPRRADSAEVRLLIDEVYRLMTSAAPIDGAPGAAEEPAKPHLSDRLPEADVGRMESLLELLAGEPFKGRADLPQLAEESELTDEDLLPLADALHRLGLARLSGGDLFMTSLGHRYVEGSHEFRREIFGQQLLAHVPLAAFIRHSLEQEAHGELKEEPFLKLLMDSMDAAEAERVLRVAIEWARYGEVFEYDFHTGLIHLPEADEG
ncbi:nitrate/sulfonate/bicarbonate ABC transporter ATP-binding protein [Roseateles sp.]|uniref:ABC transporter ATP-binding protein n=1 Tax=Roseateles sp. TaxID=1971397 RepID=UPI0025EB2D58|nr:nitrate/sulfonate/bicarbonate ABC transporter ATP-binding protein [Roseateles sp.]MBV8033621.1 nitrate/sulfonate/bicarbonate ABC transporter ATP-binding protein [Roseateles sp.]